MVPNGRSAAGLSSSTTPAARSDEPVTRARVYSLWRPLAASWILMAFELPLITIVVARMPNPEISLAAYGSIVFPLSLVIEAPIIMLLAASTALAKDRQAWGLLARFAFWSGFALSALHALVAFTPLYDEVVQRLIGPPAELLEPGRLGLKIMTPWTLAIAWRRFQQGVLIRAERSNMVGVGTLVRLLGGLTGLGLGVLMGLPGIAVGTLGVAIGVSAEALFAQFVTQPRVRELPASSPDGPLTWPAMLKFYYPLALTPLITLVVPVIGARAMSRMPLEVASLAAWTALHGIVFMLRSVGMAFNEVVVRLIGEPNGREVLEPIAWRSAALMSGLLLIAGVTPLGRLWFGGVSGLSEELTALAGVALLLAVLMPGYQMLQSWYQGTLVSAHRTRAIPISVALYMLIASALLYLGTQRWDGAGIHWVVPSLTVAGIAQTLWLRFAVRYELGR